MDAGYPNYEAWIGAYVTPKTPKQLAELKTLDEMPSPTPLVIGTLGNDVLMVMPVHGLGVLTLRATESDYETGRLKFHGVGLFTTEDIRGPILSEKS